MATRDPVFSYKDRCKCSDPRATWRIGEKVLQISLLGDLVGNAISHYFFLIGISFEFFFRTGSGCSRIAAILSTISFFQWSLNNLGIIISEYLALVKVVHLINLDVIEKFNIH